MESNTGQRSLVTWTAAVAVVLVLAAGWGAYESARVLNAASSWLRHTLEVELALERLHSGVRDAESGQRGFLITGRDEYLEPYQAALPQIEKEYRRLVELLADNPAQAERLRALRPLIDTRLAQLVAAIEAKRSSDDAVAAIIRRREGKPVTDKIRAVIDTMQNEEDALLAQREADFGRARTQRTAALVALVLLSAGLITLLVFVSRRDAAQIRRGEERLAVIFGSIGDAVVATDGTGRVERMNRVAERLTGWPLREAAGRPLDEVFRIVNEQTRQSDESPVQKVMRVGGVVGLANHTILLERGGREIPIEDSAAPIGDNQRGAGGIVLVFRDATEARALERARDLSEQRFRRLADGMPQIVYTTDGQGRVDLLNRQWFAYTGQDPSAPAVFDAVIHEDDRAALAAAWGGAQAGATPLETQIRLRGKDGQYRWFLTRAVPVRDGEGGTLRWYGTSTDIDEQIRARQSLAEEDRRKDEFLATLAHELRNPLSPIRTAAQLLRLPATDESRRRWAAGVIERQVGTMSALLDDLLEVSRISRGTLELQKRRVQLRDLIDAAIELARPLIDRRGLTLAAEQIDPDLVLEADPLRLTQVLGNLLNNAAKYTPEGGTVAVSARRVGDSVEIAVRDTGIGLAPGDLERIFDLFTQVKRTSAAADGGLGIGLALVRTLVHLHGGEVTASSAGIGQGSTFRVRLPIGDPSAGGDGPARTPPPAVAPLRVLVADDNRDGAQSLAILLEQLGHTVEVALDGEDALARAARLRPHAALIDIGMPRLDGHDVARRLRAQPWGHDVLLLAITGWGQEVDRARTEDAGFDFHLIKPVDFELVARLLAERGAG